MSFTLSDYQITATLFSNERTAVKRAVRASDGHSVILKQLVAAYPQPGHLARFSFGYEVLSKFQHPNIVRPLAWLSGQEDHLPTMVLEDKHSEDLFRYLQRFEDHRLPLETFLDMAVQLAEALSVVHYNQVIHKDLHPGNILINPVTGLTQLTDFGLASLLSREQPVLETPEKLEGVLAYISPEQTGRMNRALDYRSDFYTLGCTFYHLLSGHPPFSAEDALGLVHAHIARQQPPLTEHRPDMPQVLSDIIDKLLNKTAEERYQSALGLKKDLEKVQFALASNKPIPEFPLGMEDISDRFQVPQKLYGRADEVDLLMKRFFSAAGGKPRMLAIAGYSGIGKSALVHEVHKPIAAYNGLFCAGKFDQFQKNVPYSALQTALKGWIQHTLSLTEQRLTEKRDHLQNALGSNARVLIDFMPEFELVLGNLPPVATLGADETQNRFHLVFQQFVKTITHERPLVLFIDDIQWADRGTLNLLPLLMSEEGCRLLVIVAYRDNEVDASHPAIHTLTQIEQAPSAAGELSRITLGPLPESEVSQLLQDALHRPANEVAPLVALVHAKTAGNPFFIGEFLKTLYTEKLLDFDLTRQRWVWTIADIDAKGITDNVVDLMLGKMALLPTDTQEIIQLAACVGSRFDLDMLAKVAELPLTVVTRKLWPALRDGLLLQDGGDWYLGWVEQSAEQQPMRTEADHVLSQSSPMSPQCRFLHDRMLQAAYQSMSEDKRQHTHLRVGRLLFMGRSVETLSNTECFDITEQLNHAQPLLTQRAERISLMHLNLRSATLAKTASVWHAAEEYAIKGIALLPDDSWRTHYDESVALYEIKADCAYLQGHPEEADHGYQQLLTHVKDDLARAQLCATRLIQGIGKGDFANSIAYGKQALAYLGMPMPEDIAACQAAVAEAAHFIQANVSQYKSMAESLPEMTDQTLLVAMSVFPNLSSVYLVGNDRAASNYCAVVGTAALLRGGVSDLSVLQLASFAAYLQRIGQAEEAYAVASQALSLSRRRTCLQIANAYNLVGVLVWYNASTLQDCARLQIEGYEKGLEQGEIGRGLISYCSSMITESSIGVPLAQMYEKSLLICDLLQKKAIFHPGGVIFRHYAHALLTGGRAAESGLAYEHFEPAVAQLIENSFHRIYFLHLRASVAFWAGAPDQALKECRVLDATEHSLQAVLLEVDHPFLFALLLMQRSEVSDADLRKATDARAKIKRYAELNPRMFLHKHALLEALCAQQANATLDVVCALYKQAIDAASSAGIFPDHALACEYFARYWQEKGYVEVAQTYYQEAMASYRYWGCVPRIEAMLDRLTETRGRQAKPVITGSVRTHSDVPAATASLDMVALMKSAQLISSELDITRLSGQVLHVIMETVGASKSALIFALKSGPQIVELLDGAKEQVSPQSPVPLETSSVLPQSVVRFVLHSESMVSLTDVQDTHAFSSDAYLRRSAPRSVLCMPMSYRDKILGALYLENQLAPNAFTPDRLDAIQLLLAQTVISLENAQLFKEVSGLNEQLEQKVQLRTRELSGAMAQLESLNEELKDFSYSVSHDLRAPLRVLNGFSRTLLDEYGDKLDEQAKMIISRIEINAILMNERVQGLLELSRIQRREVVREPLNLSAMVEDVYARMRERFPLQNVHMSIQPGAQTVADHRLLYSVLENLISNAWKYSAKQPISEVSFGWFTYSEDPLQSGVGKVPQHLSKGAQIYFVKDNGVGFNMARSEGLFLRFQRLHSSKEFEGSGVGLATAKRALEKQGGSLWAYSEPNAGATFYFTV